MYDYEKYPPIIYADDFADRQNISWRVEPARKHETNPLLEPKFPWDSASPCGGHGTILKDPIDGVFKAWVVGIEEDLSYDGSGPLGYRLVHLRSEDGVDWERPELDVCPVEGHSRTNILLDYDTGGRTTYASVFVDPEANPDEPYEMFCFRDAALNCPAGLVAGFGPDAVPGRQSYRYRSVDGIHWRPDQGPVPISSADTLYVHKASDGTYVCHHKYSIPMYPGGRAAFDVAGSKCRIGWQARSEDGYNWSESIPMMVPDSLDAQGDQIMEVGRYPYNDGYIGLTAIFNGIHQEMHLQLAVSPTGLPIKTYPPYSDSGWWRPSRRPALGLEPLGDYGGGQIWPTRTLVEDGDELVIFYGALEGVHGDLYSREPGMLHFYGALCRASWEKGRMWAAVPASGGHREAMLETQPMEDTEGKKLIVNAVTRPDGFVMAELVDARGEVIPGFGRDDCQGLSGDHKCAVLSWKGGEACPSSGHQLRIFLMRARLYGFAWQ